MNWGYQPINWLLIPDYPKQEYLKLLKVNEGLQLTLP